MKLDGVELESVGEVIATREVELKPSGRKVVVTIGKPQRFPGPDGQGHYCPYQISGITRDKVRFAGGADAVQAIALAMKMVGIDLYTSEEGKAGMLSWECGRDGDLGFPAP